MLRRQRQVHTQFHKLVDSALFGVGLWLAHLVRWNIELDVLHWKRDIESFSNFLPYLYFVIITTPILLESQGFYNRHVRQSRSMLAWKLLRACCISVVSLVLFMFLLKGQLARSVFILFGLMSFGLVWMKEELKRVWVRSEIGRNQLQKRLILVGTPEDTARLRAELARGPNSNIVILDELDLNSTTVEAFVDVLHEQSASGVVMSAKHTYFGQIEQAIQACELEGVEVWLLADFLKTQISQTSVDDLNGRPTLVFRSVPEASWQSVVKQIVDLVGASLLLLLAAIPMLIVALAIRITSPGPILFRQHRSGLHGRPFVMLKFRTMVTDAEQRKHELASMNEMEGPVFKVTNDPRITPIGRILRKYSLDELPQLWNVVRGEMSLVGPRPLPVDETRRFNDLAHRRRLSVKPGLTCLWQVSGRSDVKDFKDWVRLDLEYIDNWSLWLDFKILLRTIPVVILGSGAK